MGLAASAAAFVDEQLDKAHAALAELERLRFQTGELEKQIVRLSPRG